MNPLHVERVVFAVLFLGAFTMVGCSSGDLTSGSCVDEEAAAQALNEVSEEEGFDWRDRAREIAASAPADSVIESVGVLYKSPPTAEDRSLLAEVGATITYEYITIAAFTVDLPVAGLVPLAESPNVAAVGGLGPGPRPVFLPACVENA